mmetsp:Transcript_11249/g.16827  ORF Transcript_11249/g.16827 Transcript_11249/m.16827 type:complete len:180 (-) Transcript_11249:245-784(-)|eukprot:CAMPEP_0167751796 /NCGR_PEP_ID=MMETSP0110_2-20121227/6777_1 /TAXON_ID=629695 /ORGANISM="Gymnochlora sp., Strain CCMP2014" /LENGTH=179 /DNA_ID=CAMNT_0007637331 /DNA_START=96 /DNA_END=635 /DNA_ORIENTATION=-
MSNSQASHLVRKLWNENPDAVRDKTVRILTKVLRNVLNNPTEAKYRSLGRKAIDKRFGGVNGALALLNFAGFTSTQTHYVLSDQNSLANLCDVVEIFDDRAKKIAEAEAKLKLVLDANNKKAKASQQKKEAHRKKIRLESEAAQKDVRNKVVTESKANKLNFGMKLKKFEPPKDAPRRK